jgi:DNA-binding MarR family transcriptional regulator
MDDFAEFRHFKYLLAVAEHKGFRAAADSLNTAQPSLSRQIKEFQEHYNLRLFVPAKGKRVELTPAGEALLVIAREVLEIKDDALAALEAIQRGEAQVLRIGCTPFVDKEICKRATDLQKALIPSASARQSGRPQPHRRGQHQRLHVRRRQPHLDPTLRFPGHQHLAQRPRIRRPEELA